MNNHTPDFETIFRSLPGNYLIVKPNAPNFTIAAVSDEYLEATLTKREDILGKGIFEVFPNNPDDPGTTGVAKLTRSFEAVINEKKPHEMEVQKYDVPNPTGNGFELRYWLPKNIPVLNKKEDVEFIIHSVVNITEKLADRKQIEELNIEQKVYNLFKQAPVAIGVVKGENYVIELANASLLELIGKNTDVIGKALLDAIPELDGQGFIELLDEVRTSGKPYHANEVPVTLIRKGREEVVYVNFVYQPYYETNGTVSRVMQIAVDVTEQVNARKNIEESEQRLRSIISEAPVATGLYIGREMTVQYANEAMLKLWGKNADIIGKKLADGLPELEGQPFHQLLSNVYNTGETYWGKEDRAQLVVDGELRDFFFNFTYKALRASKGEIYGILNMAIDVTEQVLAREKLIESEARSRLAVEAAHLGTFEFNLNNKTVVHSPRFAEIFGYDPNRQWEQSILLKSIYPPDLPIRNKAHEDALKTGELSYEARIFLPDKSLRWIKVNGRHTIQDGIATNTIGTVMDITDEKRNAEILEQKIKERTRELEESNELLKRSNDELEQIANAASHDLKEPLRKIRTFNQLIKKESFDVLSERSKNHLDKSSESAQRMTYFLDGLLEYSELKKPDQFTTVDLNTTISDVVNDLELVINEKSARINNASLPVVRGIPHQLHQLFYNLINNALKFSREGIPPVIDVSLDQVSLEYLEQHTNLKQENRYIEIIVKDNGIGFDEKHADDIFTIFKRLHSKAAYKGTGIGLALCKKVALNHGGDIFATSFPNQGAAFHIILPIESSSQ